MECDAARLIVAECLAGRVRILNRVISGLFDAQLRSLKIRASQLNILVVIAAHGPLGPAEVCRRLCLEKSTLSRDLERLIARGWVTATATGRRQTLEVTHPGRALIDTMRPAWTKAQAEALRLLGREFADELHRVVDGGRLALKLRKKATKR